MEYWSYVLAVICGFLLGLLFFGGLWLTVRRSLFSKRPGLWFLFSMCIRTSVTVAGFVLVSGGSAVRLLCCVAGFALAKLAVLLLTRQLAKEGEPCI
jgi:F1F0 ATPase subunit 2